MKAPIIIAAVAACALAGCASNRPLSHNELALAVRIAVRHAVADSSRAHQKAENIRNVVVRLQAIATADTTVSALKAEVLRYIDELTLTPIQRADALDVLDYFAAVIEAQIGEETFDNARLVQIQEFLALILAALPAQAGGD